MKQATSAVQAQSWLFCFFCSVAFFFLLNRSFYLNKSMENWNWKKLNSKKNKVAKSNLIPYPNLNSGAPFQNYHWIYL